ncbi:NUDIX hydrolase [Solimonas marina]|uniref:NUDIX hydrolase n=1 Tax=Solimonas marina TaxID=2714601 RepID=A0A970B9C6_9GAMM|nr:NUDIX hydrolase [Solimonas marina]NKF22266.1 NUDIX hydrolase [Solimonas marina]
MDDATIETLYRGKFLALQRDRHWEYVSRVNSSGAGFIAALTDAGELLLVEQYRLPLHARTIELPAGMIGDEVGLEHESVEASTMRELEEETGYRGTQAQVLLSGPVAAGMTSEMLHLVRIRGLTQVGAGGGVAGEDITVHRVPLAEIDGWLRGKATEGLLIEPRIYAALYFIHRDGA